MPLSGASTVKDVGDADVTFASLVPNFTAASAMEIGKLKPVIVTTVPITPLGGETETMTGFVCATR